MLYIWNTFPLFPIGIRDIPDDWKRCSPKGIYFSYFKKINVVIYIPTTVTSTLGDVDDTGITTAAILPVGASV